MKEIAVVGGGAAGMIAAFAAASYGCRVTLFEKNEKLGKKLFITGKGRCNLTNDADQTSFLSNVVRNPKFLYSALHAFSSEDIKRFLTDRGCPVKTERGLRVFPESDKSSDVIKTLEKALKELGVTVLLHTEVKRLKANGSRIEGLFASSSGKDERFYAADEVIVATGGVTYPATGSTGDGYKFASSLQIPVTETYPSLVPLNVAESWPKSLTGLTLKNVSVTFYDGEKKLMSCFGELLFTHFGISGPIVLTASAYLTKHLHENGRVRAVLDLKPAMSDDVLDKRLLREFSEAPNKRIGNVLPSLVPSSLVSVILTESGIAAEKTCSRITKEERASLLKALKALIFTVTGTRGPEEAVVTAGGVDVREINPKTMRCKRYENLYFAGEVLDVDALTGGFNLQIAWSTGYLAGSSAAE